MDWAQVVLSSLGGGGVVGALVIFVLKKSYEGRVQKDIERQKASLARSALEHQIQFSHLHIKRAEAIAESYRLLGSVLRTASDYTKTFELAGDTSREERAASASEALNAARDYLLGSTIYFPTEIAKEVEALIKSVNHELIKFQFTVDLGPSRTPDYEQWSSISHELNERLPKVLDSLSDEFRSLLDPLQQD